MNVDAATLNYANGVIAALGFWGTFDQVPVVDGDFIVERPTTTMKRGKLNGVRHELFSTKVGAMSESLIPFLQKMLYSNTNSYEGRFFMNTNLTDVSIRGFLSFRFAHQARLGRTDYDDVRLRETDLHALQHIPARTSSRAIRKHWLHI